MKSEGAVRLKQHACLGAVHMRLQQKFELVLQY